MQYKVFTATKGSESGLEGWLNEIAGKGFEIVSVVMIEQNRFRVIAKRQTMKLRTD